MVVTQYTAAGTSSAVLVLSKAAWKLGSSLSKLDQDTRIVDTTVKDLAREVKSLGNECDLIYAELEEVVSESGIGSPLPYDIDGKIWSCLVTQVEETSQTMQELDLFVKSVRGEESSLIAQGQRQRKLDNSRDHITSIRTRVYKQTDNLRTTLLLINTVLTHIAPCRADWRLAQKLDKLQDTIVKLQRLAETNSDSRPSYVEDTLIRCAREVVVTGTTMCDANPAAESVSGGQGAANSNIRVAEWGNTLKALRWDQRHSDSPATAISGDEAHTVVTSTASAQCALQKREPADAVGSDTDDDLDTDLAKAALETGTKAFEAQEWEEADSLLQEALRVLHQLPKQQRTFCDIFGLHYKLAVCAYHTREPADAEEALMSLVQHSACSDERRAYIYDATHLLSCLYVRMGQVDRARSGCEKALQARRRLLGKHSDASLESTALMAHIYMLLNNRARAKSCLAMIPEARRDSFQKIVEVSLATKVEHRDLSSPPTRSISQESGLVEKRSKSRPSASPLALPIENHCYEPVSAMVRQSPFINIRQAEQCVASEKMGLEDLQSVTVTSLSSAEGRRESRDMGKERANESYSAYPGPLRAAALSLGKLPVADENFKAKTLSRKEILANMGCSPKDGLEDAVCDGDYPAFAKLLNSKKSFWRSKLRKRVRPERVTALHFAALFGEIIMARCLLGSSFNINEVPYGYTTSLTPLKFAIGARQVEMVEFLIANGANPSEPDSWSTLAGQLMNRSWLKKTMSEAEKEYVPNQITAILKTLLKHGWDVNAPFEPTGRRVLHQAVGFWTGSYVWDLNLRAVVTSFLCEQGADPFRADTAGKTPYDMALASGHQDLLLVLGRGLEGKEQEDGPAEPIELSSEPGETWLRTVPMIPERYNSEG